MAFRFSEIRDLVLQASNLASVADIRAQNTSNAIYTSAQVPLPSLTVADKLLPSTTLSNISIGTSNQRFKEAWIDELHLSSNTLYLGDTPILGTTADTVNIRADPDQSILVKTTGLGVSSLSSQKGVTVSTSGINSVIDFLASGSGGSIALGAASAVNINAPSTTITSNLTVNGNIAVNGTTFTVNAQTVEVKDNIIVLNSGQVGSGVTAGTAGISIDRGDALDYQLLFDEADDKFKMGPQGSLIPIATEAYVGTAISNVSVSGSAGPTDASNITTGILPVLRGGTGTTTSTGTGSVALSSNPAFTGNVTVSSNVTASNNLIAAGNSIAMGNMGVGASNPAFRLDVSSSGTPAARFFTTGGTGTVFVEPSRGAYYGISGMGFNAYCSGNNIYNFTDATKSRWAFYNYGNSFGWEYSPPAAIQGNVVTFMSHSNIGSYASNGVPKILTTYQSDMTITGDVDITGQLVNYMSGVSLSDAQTLSNYQVVVKNSVTAGEACGVAFVSGLSAGDTSTPGASIVYERTGGANWSGNLHFKTQAGSTTNPLSKRMSILSTGNVGVGTSNPSQLLEVAGTVLATRVLAAVGSSNVPSISFGGSYSNTGFYAIGSNMIAYSSSGKKCFDIRKDGESNGGTYIDVGVADGTSPTALYLGAPYGGSNQWWSIITDTSGNLVFTRTGGFVSYITPSGVFTSASDDRIKSEESLLTDALSTVLKLRPQIYKRNPAFEFTYDSSNFSLASNSDFSPSNSIVEAGLIAQEIFYDAPELRYLINVPADADPSIWSSNIPTSSNPQDDPMGYYQFWGSTAATVNYSGFVPYLVQAIKEQQAMINVLKQRLDSHQL
jgi:hypothetical protein